MRIPEYQSFGEIWQQHLQPYAAKFSGPTFPIVATDDRKEAELDATIHLPEWPASSGRRRHRPLDILVRARERFALNNPSTILESTINVTYWEVDRTKKIAKALSTIHYDYDRAPRQGHPVYHCHCSDHPASDGRLPASWQFAPQPKLAKTHFPFRIPTPHMGLCSVLIGLVADHLPDKSFKELCKAIKEKGWTPPLAERCDLWNLGQVAAAPRVIHSWQWYFWPE